jgi:hypothetical protein
VNKVHLMGGCGILARRRGHHNISSMRLSLIVTCVLVWAPIFASAVSAQVLPPGGSQFNPPIPAPPPPPKIEVPVVPQMDAPSSRSYAPAPRPSFGDRITKCLDDAAASGLGPNERATYSLRCAN